MLALDPPLGRTGDARRAGRGQLFGPRRTRYGSVRDLIIGISVVRADGTRGPGGGKVVKNVAGFDLPKLMCGSLGTLGFIATVTFRVHPVPRADGALPRAGAGRSGGAGPALRSTQLEPAADAALVREGGETWDVRYRPLRRIRGGRAGAAGEAPRALAECEWRGARAFWARMRASPLRPPFAPMAGASGERRHRRALRGARRHRVCCPTLGGSSPAQVLLRDRPVRRREAARRALMALGALAGRAAETLGAAARLRAMHQAVKTAVRSRQRARTGRFIV